MVRATAAEVVKLFGNTYPAGWDATTVGYLCAIVDDELDEYGLSASDQGAVTLANYLVYRRIIHATWAAAGGILSGQNEPKVWTDDLVELKNRLAEHGTYEFVASVDTVNDGDRTE